MLTHIVAATLLGAALAPDTTAPTTPTDLHVRSLSFTEVSLGWDRSTDDSGWTMYTVEVTAPGELRRYGATEPNKTFTALAQGRTYTASVLAVDGAHNESAWTSIQFTTPVDTQPPTTPANVRVVGPGDAYDVVRWDAAVDNSNRLVYTVFAESQPIYRTSEPQVGVVDLLNTCLVAPGSTHSLTVQARDMSNNLSPRSAPVTVTVPALG